MRAILLLLALAGCRADAPEPPSPATPAALPPVSTVRPFDPPPDSMARWVHGRPFSADSFETIRSSIDTSYSRTVAILPHVIPSPDLEYPARDGQRWQGLFETPTGLEIRSFTARVREVEAGPLEPPGGPYSGRLLLTPWMVETDDPRHPISAAHLFFRRPGRPFADGPVATVFVGYWPLYQGKLPFSFGGESYDLTFLEGPENKNGWRWPILTLRSQDGRQYLPSAGMDNYLLWAGDLDRDGRLDLLTDEGGHYAVGEPTLYLSSEARDGELVRRVAWTSTCDC
ncbi:hypothetical protein [Rubrivirga sp. IMCC43871]|uniref:hypothetical protein n=1 Tax=Rubrivirga sp. IMCC43871 TaxID=3391575 RepID=UPI00399019EF